MLLKKRVDYGFQGYQVPAVPRGPRSVRKRGRHKNLLEDSRVCPFELLAAVAGKLLQENQSSASTNAEEGKDHLKIFRDGIKHELSEEDKGFRFECLDQGSCVESAFIPDSAACDQNSECIYKEIPPTPVVTCSDISKDVNLHMKLKTSGGDIPNNVKEESSNLGNLYDNEINNGSDRQVKDDRKPSEESIAVNTCSLKDLTEGCVNNNNALINLKSSVQFPLYRDPIPSASVTKHRANVKLGLVRDDDENYFGRNSTKLKAFKPRPQSRFGYRRIRKILTSKYWKVAPKLKDSDLANTYEGMKPFYRNRKSLYGRERCHREPPSKRRKLHNHSFVLTRDQEASSKIIRNSPEKEDNISSAPFLHRASGPSASVKAFKKSRDANVKFRIKSFKVPELYIEVPETATVGALKRTVMESVTAILEGGLRVGVVHKGKRVRDDKRTLQQAGISDSSNLEALGFALEPSLNQVSPTVSPIQPPSLHPHDADQLFSRSPAKPNLDLGLPISSTSYDPAPASKMEKPVEFSHEFSPRNPVDEFTDAAVQDSKALVPFPAMNVEALNVVPINQKPRCSELSHRRIRRPFSVAEVEALVEAVETLGTGRWRDVKVHAFDNADHRTYVDLKDKWKTLVHTATISPQQRRGAPVPQELLDRVLSAHGFWSQHQSKQHGKHHD